MFRTLMAGRRTVHITSNRLVSSIFRMDGKGVSATMPQTKLLFKIVGIQGEQERIQHLVHGALIPIMDRYLSPASLEFATAGYPALLSGRFTAPYEIGKIHTISLKDFVRNHLYGIGCSLVLGRGFPSDEAREPFWTFEDGSPRIIALPFFAKKALRSRERLVDIIKAHLQQTENNGFASSSEHFAEIITTLRGANTSDDVLARIVVAYMFALQTNTIWTAFWAIAYTLRDPEMYQRLRREVDDLVFSRHGNDINRVDASDLLKPESMPLMNSIVLETQRLCAMDVSFRLVEHDFTLSDDQGLPVHFNKGETLLPSAIAVHHDPTIFDSPYEFRGDRFIDNSGNPAKLDGKNGRLLSSYIFAFGGGVSLVSASFRHFIRLLTSGDHSVRDAPLRDMNSSCSCWSLCTCLTCNFLLLEIWKQVDMSFPRLITWEWGLSEHSETLKSMSAVE